MVSAYNHARNEFVEVDAGFFIVKTFTRLYDEYKDRYGLQHNRYALPRIDRMPMESQIQYRGLARVLQTYQTAIEEHYRFYSFGDAMLII